MNENRLFFVSDPFNWKNEWTNETIQQEDIGAGRFRQYTSRHHRANEWYNKWLPDQTRFDSEEGKTSKSNRFNFVPFHPEDRSYVFIIPPPYLAASNDTDPEKYQWKIVEPIQNETDHNDDPVEKRTVIFVCLFGSLQVDVLSFILLRTRLSSHCSWENSLVIHRTSSDHHQCRRKSLDISNKSAYVTWLLLPFLHFNHLLLCFFLGLFNYICTFFLCTLREYDFT